MTALSFLNAPLLWGMLAAAIPLIIQLLYRRKYRRVDWAPMRYLKLSIEQHRRRIRLEQLLLLLVRMAAMALLFLLLARPVMHAAGLTGWLGAGHRQSRLLVIDDSLSMGLQTAGSSPWQRAQEVARQIVEQGSSRERVTIVATSRPSAPLVREVELSDRPALLALLAALKPAETFTDWAPTLSAIEQLLEGSSYPIQEVTLLTDLCLAGWEQPLTELSERWHARGTRLEIFDLGGPATDNLAVLRLAQIEHVSLVGTSNHWQAIVRNDTAAEISELEADWIVDGKPSLVRIESIPVGGETSVPLPVTFNQPGPHHVSFRLPADPLLGDNRWWNVTAAKPNLRIVLVDGGPSTDPWGGEVDFLAIALSLGVGQAEAFEVTVVTDTEWAETDLANADLLVLANVPSLTEAEAEQLSRWVEQGLGLVLFPGDQVDPEAYNRWLHRAGEGLLPAALETVVDEELQGLLVAPWPASPLAALRDLKPSVLEQIRLRRHWQLTLPDQVAHTAAAPSSDLSHPAAVRIVAHWNNAAGSPAAIEKQWGEGRVLLWTIPADKQWSGWPTQPSFVLAMRESTLQLARRGTGERTVTAGSPLRYQHRPGQNRVRVPLTSATVDVPGSDVPQAARIDAEGQAVFAATTSSGLYRLLWKTELGDEGETHFAVNPDVRESDLSRITPEALRERWLPLVPEVIAPSQAGASLALQGREVWRSLALGLFGLLCLESCLATWTGRSH